MSVTACSGTPRNLQALGVARERCRALRASWWQDSFSTLVERSRLEVRQIRASCHTHTHTNINGRYSSGLTLTRAHVQVNLPDLRIFDIAGHAWVSFEESGVTLLCRGGVKGVGRDVGMFLLLAEDS